MNSAAADAMAAESDVSYRLESVEWEEHRTRASVVVRPELTQPSGGVGSGVYAAVAERLASIATARGVGPDRTVSPMSNQMSLMRPITDGVIHAIAIPRHRGRTTWVWEVEFSDGRGRLCALSRMTIAVGESAEG